MSNATVTTTTIGDEPGQPRLAHQGPRSTISTRLLSMCGAFALAGALALGSGVLAAFGPSGFGTSTAYAAPDDGKGPDKPDPDDEGSDDTEEAEEEEEMTFTLEDICEYEKGDVWYDRINPWVYLIGCDLPDGSDWWCTNTGTVCGENWSGTQKTGTDRGERDPRKDIMSYDAPQMLAGGSTSPSVMFRGGAEEDQTNIRDHRGHDDETNIRDHRGQGEAGAGDGKYCVRIGDRDVCVDPADADENGRVCVKMLTQRVCITVPETGNGNGGRPGGLTMPDAVVEHEQAVDGGPVATPEPDNDTAEEDADANEGSDGGARDDDEPSNAGPQREPSTDREEASNTGQTADQTDAPVEDQHESAEEAVEDADETSAEAVEEPANGNSSGAGFRTLGLFLLAGMALAGPSSAIAFAVARRQQGGYTEE